MVQNWIDTDQVGAISRRKKAFETSLMQKENDG
jgi:hypothetical protein